LMVLVLIQSMCNCLFFFFFNDTATTEIYTLSLHDALPILIARLQQRRCRAGVEPRHSAAEQFHVQLVLLQIQQV